MIDRRLKLLYRAVPLKEPVFRAMKSLHLIPPPSIHQRLSSKGIVTASIGGSKFQMYGYGAIEASIFWRGLGNGWEGVSVRTWAELCKHHDVIVDVGANSGVFALIAKAVNPTGRVFAFEPMPLVFAQLERNRALNDFDIELIRAAASNFDGFAPMWEPVDDLILYSGTVNIPDPNVPAREITGRCLSLSTFAEERGISRIGLIKIDVEGHEPEVIEGLGHLLKHRPTMLFEVWNEDRGTRNNALLIESLLRDLGYLYFATDEETPFRRVSRIESHDPRYCYTNFIACTEEAVAASGLIA